MALQIVGSSGIVVGADVSLEMLKSARVRLTASIYSAVNADGQALPFKGGAFDAVVCQLGLQFFRRPATGIEPDMPPEGISASGQCGRCAMARHAAHCRRQEPRQVTVHLLPERYWNIPYGPLAQQQRNRISLRRYKLGFGLGLVPRRPPMFARLKGQRGGGGAKHLFHRLGDVRLATSAQILSALCFTCRASTASTREFVEVLVASSAHAKLCCRTDRSSCPDLWPAAGAPGD